MKMVRLLVTLLTLLIVGTLSGCSSTPTKSPDVSDSIRKSLDQDSLKDVSVSQDRDKGVVTLGGHVPLTVTSHRLNPLPSQLRADKLFQTRLG